jgi:hypothetical protein
MTVAISTIRGAESLTRLSIWLLHVRYPAGTTSHDIHAMIGMLEREAE